VSFELHKNEILGIAGVQGNGQSELVSSIIGMEKIRDGYVAILESEKATVLNNLSIMERLKYAISYIPEDRNKEGMIPNFSVSENIWLAYHDLETEAEIATGETQQKSFLSILTIPINLLGKLARLVIDRFSVKTPSSETKMKNLSGGNQQKVIVGREIMKNPRVLVINQPTRGVDIGVMQKIHEEIIKLRNSGTGVLLVSSDLDEVLTLSDRLLVMYSGKIVAEGTIEEIGMGRLSHLMIGGKEEEA